MELTLILVMMLASGLATDPSIINILNHDHERKSHQSNPRQLNHNNKPGCDMTYDYVVVGAGASGSAVAERLSASGASVVIIEQGGFSNGVNAVNNLARWVELLVDLQCALRTGDASACPTDTYDFLDLKYTTTPSPELIDPLTGTPGRRIPVFRSAITGGCTAHNAGIWLRPPDSDWNNWGIPGWYFDQNLKRIWEEVDQVYFKDATFVNSKSDFWTQVFIKACKEQGYPFNPDTNSGKPYGCQLQTYAAAKVIPGKGAERTFAWTQFLEPATYRKNLGLLIWSQVTKILFKGNRAIGVKVLRKTAPYDSLGGKMFSVCARKEVIISAGAIDTVSLLMQSGIGDRTKLQKLGIKVRNNLPAVGQNLQDHLRLAIAGPPLQDQDIALPIIMPSLTMLAWTWNDIIEWTPAEESYVQSYRASYGNGLASPPTPDLKNVGKTLVAGCTDIDLDSRGTVTIVSENPEVKPVIDYDIFSAPGDLPKIRECVRKIRRFLVSDTLLPLYEPTRRQANGVFPIFVYDPAGNAEPIPSAKQSDVDNYIRASLVSNGHVSGTARMGKTPFGPNAAVVDPRLRVFRMKGLRIADASILPKLFKSNPQTGLYMIGIQAAEFILEDNAHK